MVFEHVLEENVEQHVLKAKATIVSLLKVFGNLMKLGMLYTRAMLVFVKDASLYLLTTATTAERREIVITSAKHESERSTTASESAIYKEHVIH